MMAQQMPPPGMLEALLAGGGGGMAGMTGGIGGGLPSGIGGGLPSGMEALAAGFAAESTDGAVDSPQAYLTAYCDPNSGPCLNPERQLPALQQAPRRRKRPRPVIRAGAAADALQLRLPPSLQEPSPHMERPASQPARLQLVKGSYVLVSKAAEDAASPARQRIAAVHGVAATTAPKAEASAAQPPPKPKHKPFRFPQPKQKRTAALAATVAAAVVSAKTPVEKSSSAAAQAAAAADEPTEPRALHTDSRGRPATIIEELPADAAPAEQHRSAAPAAAVALPTEACQQMLSAATAATPPAQQGEPSANGAPAAGGRDVAVAAASSAGGTSADDVQLQLSAAAPAAAAPEMMPAETQQATAQLPASSCQAADAAAAADNGQGAGATAADSAEESGTPMAPARTTSLPSLQPHPKPEAEPERSPAAALRVACANQQPAVPPRQQRRAGRNGPSALGNQTGAPSPAAVASSPPPASSPLQLSSPLGAAAAAFPRPPATPPLPAEGCFKDKAASSSAAASLAASAEAADGIADAASAAAAAAKDDPSDAEHKQQPPAAVGSTGGVAGLAEDGAVGSNDGLAVEEAEAKADQMRRDIAARTDAAYRDDPHFKRRLLAELNAEAAALYKAEDFVGAVASYAKLFARCRCLNIGHPQLYVCHANRAAAHLRLGLHAEALLDAERCRALAEASFKRNAAALPQYVKAFARKGQALQGLGRHREAAATFEAGLQVDPFHYDLRTGLQAAQQGVLADLLSGKGRETRALPPPAPTQRVTAHPFAAPLHRIRTEDMLPAQLLTPFQAEKDHHVRDTYNYVTIQTDIKMPGRAAAAARDAARQEPWQAAIEAAVVAIEATDTDCRVLDIGSNAGLHGLMALRAGALHATLAQRWLYLSLAAKEAASDNGFSDEQASDPTCQLSFIMNLVLRPRPLVAVVYKRPTDLAPRADVPVVCNLLLADIMDEGLLASGLIPAVRHSLLHLLTADARVLPAAATVFFQAAEVRTAKTAGVDVSPMDRHRWHHAYLSGAPLAAGMFRPLSAPQEAWHFTMASPPEDAESKTLDVTFTAGGRLNAVVFWFELDLGHGFRLSTGPQAVAAGLKTLGPAVQYLAGEMAVEAGMVLPLRAAHNTVRLRFDVEEAEYLNLTKADASFPPRQFAMLADARRNEAYAGAISRAVARKKAEDGEAHVLDVGSGSGLLAVLAAKAGASSVVTCELHEGLAAAARRVVAVNGAAEKVSVVQKDAGLLERGKQVRRLGVNLVTADFFDAGLLGDNWLYLLELAKKNVVQPDAAVVPAAATLYVMGLELPASAACGFDLSCMNKYRYEKSYQAVFLDEVPHRRLTKPRKVFEYFFEGRRPGRGRENIVKLEVVAEGTLNAVAFWFDLHLDAEETLTTAPLGVGLGGRLDGGKAAAAAQPAGADVPQASSAPGASAGSSGAAAPQMPHHQQAPAMTQAQGGDGDSAQCASSASAAAGPRPTENLRGPDAFSARAAAAGAATAETAGGSAPLQQPCAPTGDAAPSAADELLPGASGDDTASGSTEGPNEGRQQQHYWGQALQHLDREVEVQPGKKLTLLAKRDGGTIRFSLRAGVGEEVERPPWLEEWGGGASVENPHVQRVHYCSLLVRDFLQRVKCGRFPPIEKDMRMVAAHCGSLFLDPTALTQVYHELVVLEQLHKHPEFCPGASLEAITRPPLLLY